MSFIPKRLYAKDFLNHRESEIDFTLFNSCLVVGRNCRNDRESNGSGKSNLISWAINYVLFNKYPTKKIERVVREGQEQCLVEFEFFFNDEIWKATRKRSNKSNSSEFRLYKWIDGKWDNQERRTSSSSDAALQELIKINYEAFKNSVMFVQGAFSELAEGTDAEKRKILKEPLRLAVYSKLEKLAKNKYSVVEKEFDKVKTLIISLGDPAADVVLLAEELKKIDAILEQAAKDRKSIKAEIAQCYESVSALEKMLSSDAAQITDKLIEQENKKRELNSLINKYTEKAVGAEEDLATAENSKNAALQSLLDLKTNLDSLESQEVRSEEKVNTLIVNLEAKETKGHKYIASLEVDYDKFSKPLPEGSECDVCFNELTDEYRAKISVDNKLKAVTINDNLVESRQKMQVIAETKRKLYQELKDIAQHHRDVERVSSAITNKVEEIGRLDNLAGKFKQLAQENQAAAEDTKTQLVEVEKKIQLLRGQAENFDVTEINDQIITLKNDIRDKEIKENNLIQIISDNSSLKGVTEERKRKRETDQQQLEALGEQRIQLERKVRIHAWVVKAFSASGIPTLIIHTILDDLQVEANKILQDLRPDLSLQFKVEKEDKDALDITYFINGRDREYSQLSGGQKMYMTFALKLGLSLVIQKRLGADIRFLALDEVDQPLDDAGQDAYVDIIRKYHDKYKICVVTHNNRLKDKFSHAIFVEDDGPNGSTAKVVTQW